MLHDGQASHLLPLHLLEDTTRLFALAKKDWQKGQSASTASTDMGNTD
jgi:hypothetical protein